MECSRALWESDHSGREVTVCVVGSGIAGMAAAHYLTDRPGVSVTVLEGRPEHGGRANETDDGEHCARLFLSDYRYLFDLFGEIPAEKGGTVLDSLRKCRRFAGRGDGSWVEIDHVYAFLARTRGLTVRDKVAIARGNWHALLVARRSIQSSNVFGSIWNWSPRPFLRALATSRRERITYALPGSTERHLVTPWIRFLESRGVEFRAGCRVDSVSIHEHDPGVDVVVAERAHHYDAVIFTGFAPDAYGLLDRSGIARPLDTRVHTHCKALTVDLDPREAVLDGAAPRIYAGGGITTVVQPDDGRCVTLAAFPPSTQDDFLLDRVREQLSLRFPPVRVRVRDNHRADEAVFIGDYVNPELLERPPLRGRVYFAGSYTDTTYPLDSGEAACRSAYLAVHRLVNDHPGAAVRSVLGLPAAVDRAVRDTGPAHPNASARPAVERVMRALAGRAAAVITRISADVVFDDRSGCAWPMSGPAVFVANHRSVFDVPAGLHTFARLKVTPRLVVAGKYFAGALGRMLRASGAMPAVRGSDATINAGIAAVRAGESVAIMPEGRITPQGAETEAGYGRGAAMIAVESGVPVVPIAARGTAQVWPGNRPWPVLRRRRPRVVIAIGAPIDPTGRTWQEIGAAIRAEILRLESGSAVLEPHQDKVAA